MCDFVVDMFLEILFKFLIVDWKWFCNVFKFVCKLFIVEIVVFIEVNNVEVLVLVNILEVVILRFVVLNLVMLVCINVWDERLIEIVWFEFVFIKKCVEKVFDKILMLVNCVVVVIWEILVCNVLIFFWSVLWLVLVLILFWDWIVSVWICCNVVVVLVIVFLVVCVREMLLFVFFIVWFNFWICDVIWFVIWRFVVLFVVLLILKLDDKCLKVVLRLLLVVNNCFCVFSDDILVFMNKFMRFF